MNGNVNGNVKGSGGLRLHVDWTACDGRGLCAELLPEILREDDWGFPVAHDGGSDPAVPPALASDARRAVDRCPALALRLVGPAAG